MRRFLLRRLLGAVVTLLIASIVVYLCVYLSPGSPEQVLFGSRPPSPEVQAQVREYLGLDQSPVLRYLTWLGHVLSGDLGTSLITQQPVSSRIADPALVTLSLVAYAAVLIVLLGVGSGLLAALRPGPVDAGVTTLTSVATAVPAFVAAGVLISVFAVQLGWFPAYGQGDGVVGWWHGLTLPAVALAILASGLVSRVTRASARQELASEHVETARMRGISGGRLLRSHVLHNAAPSVVTVIGLQVAGLVAGAVVVEQAFGLNGLGGLLISSVQQKDFPVVQAIALVVVGAFVLLNLLADLVVMALDPRARVVAR
ncbi:ABC transporter permease [Nocardioides mangrovi]|uniref:ABC transporter permease n=1 Tax=Nocardioides mangrovi TaxID=2874580 RepID=A0ABS7U7Y9_9ACTN|nr:ABC transporter permease [Nocardioides mangrovi]MBZ5737094.1 ABC transporter permease [Nocardioides mangrovi]